MKCNRFFFALFFSFVLNMNLNYIVIAETVNKVENPMQSPKLYFKENIWDFGEIMQGEKVSHTFEMQNIGGSELIIKKVRSTCGCTAVSPSKKKLKPGETAYLKTTFNSAGRKDYQTKKIYVTTNDLSAPTSELEIAATVKVPEGPRIKLSQTVWDFGLQELGSTPKCDVVIKNEGVYPLEFQRIHTSDQCSATLIPEGAIAPDNESVLRIELIPLQKAGIVELYVNLLSNDTTHPNSSVRIMGYVKGDLPPKLSVSPKKWDFGVVEKENFVPKQTLIYMRNVGGKDLIVKEIKMPFGFETGIELPFTIAPSQEKGVPFKLTRVASPGTVKQLVFIYTNESGFSNRRVEVYGYVKSLIDKK